MRHPSPPPLTAIAYVPADLPTDTVAAAIAASCDRIAAAGYHLGGIVREWQIAAEMMSDGRAAVTVIADQRHLPVDRTPRIELADDPIRDVPTRCTPPGASWSPVRRARRVR